LLLSLLCLEHPHLLSLLILPRFSDSGAGVGGVDSNNSGRMPLTALASPSTVELPLLPSGQMIVQGSERGMRGMRGIRERSATHMVLRVVGMIGVERMI
jgi:hypothetical protein